jgi:hypothetical protein
MTEIRPVEVEAPRVTDALTTSPTRVSGVVT